MRKFLSMVLALAMTMSLFTFVSVDAGAKNYSNYTDDADVKYEEAVDVISAIKVMEGYSDGTFGPQRTLTRNAATKIVCNMILGPAVAAVLPSSANPFKDVAAGGEFSGYIAYCAEHGIISGYSDGTFKGGDPLSGYAFLKMLLGALGYNAEKEGFVGANWKVNVAKQATGVTCKLTRGLENADEFDGSTIVTREEAALYAFNTLCADMVEYGERTNSVGVVLGGDVARSREWTGSAGEYNNIIPAVSQNANRHGDSFIVQFGEENFPRLVRRNHMYQNRSDGFGRPSTQWTYKGVEVGTYPETPMVTYYQNTSVNTIYSDLNMLDSDPEGAEFYVNGYDLGTISMRKGNSDDLTACGTGGGDFASAAAAKNYADQHIGDGTITEVFWEEDYNHVIICSRSVYGGKVTAVKPASNTKDDYVVIMYCPQNFNADNGNQYTWKTPDGIGGKNKNEFETTEFDEDDVVGYTYSETDNEIKEMWLLDSVEGSLTRRTVTKNLTLGSDVYSYAKMYAFDDIRETDMANKSDYVIYLDDNGWVLWVEEAEFSVEDYALIERISAVLDYPVTIDTTGSRDPAKANYNPNYGKVTSVNTVDDKTKVRGYALNESMTAATNQIGTLADYANNETNPYCVEQLTESLWGENRAKLLFANGTERTVYLDKSYLATASENDPAEFANAGLNRDGIDLGNDFMPGNIVRATTNSKGQYKLTPVVGNYGFSSRFEIARNTMTGLRQTTYGNYTLNSGAVISSISQQTNTNLAADSKTVFVFKDGSDWKVYTGIRNTPNIAPYSTSNPYNSIAFAYQKDGVAKVVFVTNGKTSNTSKDVTFIAAKSMSNRIASDNTKYDYRQYSAVVKGEIQTIEVMDGLQISSGIAYLNGNRYPLQARNDADKQWRSVLINDYEMDSDDIITSASWVNTQYGVTTHATVGVHRYEDGEIKIGTGLGNGNSQAVADNVKVFWVDGDGNIEEVDITDIRTDSDDIVYYTLEDGEITNLFVCEYDSVGDGWPWATVQTPTTTTGTIVIDTDYGRILYRNFVVRPTIPEVVNALQDHGCTDISYDASNYRFTFTYKGIPYNNVYPQIDTGSSYLGARLNTEKVFNRGADVSAADILSDLVVYVGDSYSTDTRIASSNFSATLNNTLDTTTAGEKTVSVTITMGSNWGENVSFTRSFTVYVVEPISLSTNATVPAGTTSAADAATALNNATITITKGYGSTAKGGSEPLAVGNIDIANVALATTANNSITVNVPFTWNTFSYTLPLTVAIAQAS